MVKGAPGNLQKEKIINKRKHAGRRSPTGIKYFETRMVYRLQINADSKFVISLKHKGQIELIGLPFVQFKI